MTNNGSTANDELTNLVACIRVALDWSDFGAAYALIRDLERHVPLTATYWHARTADAYRNSF